MKTNKRRAIVALGSVLGAAALSSIAEAGKPQPTGPASAPVSTTATGSAGTSATVSGSASVTAQAAVAGKAAAHNNSRSNRSGGVLGSQHTLGKAKPARPVVGAANFTG